MTTEIPSPRLVTAWLVLNALPTERIPLWAAHWLAAGHDGQNLAELAGLHGNDPREVRDLLPAALIECGVPATDLDRDDRSCHRAAAMTAFTAIAKRCVNGQENERWVADAVGEVIERDFDMSTTELPLGRLYGLCDEWDADWGRTDEQLRTDVRVACYDQLRAAQTPSQTGTEPDTHGETTSS